MPDVPIDYLETITAAINQVTGASKNAALAILTQLTQENEYATPMDMVEDALKALEPLFEQLTMSTASLSAQAYDIVRLAEMGDVFGAIPYQDRDPEWTRKALYGIAKHSATPEAFIQSILDRLDYEAKRAAGSTSFKNGYADAKGKPMFARVPTGRETCPFCIMLASRGFVYRSSKTAGQLDHYHAHCDCRVVPSFGGGSIRGYDPDKYYDQYLELLAEGKLNPAALERSAAKAHGNSSYNAKKRAQGQSAFERWQIRQALNSGQRFAYEGKGPGGKRTSFVVPSSASRSIPSEITSKLGYHSGNRDSLFQEIMTRSKNHSMTRRSNGSYSQNVRVKGANGQMARVMLEWEQSGDEMILKRMQYLKAGANR